MSPRDCKRYISCSAPLCPLDEGLALRIWYSDEHICSSQQHSKHRWIKKQRSIQRRQTKSWLDRPITYLELYDASRKKAVSQDMLEHLEKMRLRRNQIQMSNEILPIQPGGM